MLDAGCGTGYFCRMAEDAGASRVVGVDLSPRMISRAKLNCSQTELISANLCEFNFEANAFDIIICGLVLGYIEDIAPVFKKFSSSLRLGGHLILTDFHPFLSLQNSKRTFKDKSTQSTFEIKHHVHLFSEIINSINQAKLSIERLEEPQWNGMPVVYGMRIIKQ